MKLIHCNKCGDVVTLRVHERWCECGSSGGRYLADRLHAEIWGECTPLGFHNALFGNALNAQPEEGMGRSFEAFIIPKVCPTVTITAPPLRSMRMKREA